MFVDTRVLAFILLSLPQPNCLRKIVFKSFLSNEKKVCFLSFGARNEKHRNLGSRLNTSKMVSLISYIQAKQTIVSWVSQHKGISTKEKSQPVAYIGSLPRLPQSQESQPTVVSGSCHPSPQHPGGASKDNFQEAENYKEVVGFSPYWVVVATRSTTTGQFLQGAILRRERRVKDSHQSRRLGSRGPPLPSSVRGADEGGSGGSPDQPPANPLRETNAPETANLSIVMLIIIVADVHEVARMNRWGHGQKKAPNGFADSLALLWCRQFERVSVRWIGTLHHCLPGPDKRSRRPNRQVQRTRWQRRQFLCLAGQRFLSWWVWHLTTGVANALTKTSNIFSTRCVGLGDGASPYVLHIGIDQLAF